MKPCLAAIAVFFFAMAGWAHHSPSAVFDMAKRHVVTGKLTKVNWVNPHIVIQMEGVTQGTTKSESWTMESNPPAWFRRVGVNRPDFAKAIGKDVTVETLRARDGSAYGYMQKITFPDKTSLELVVEQGH